MNGINIKVRLAFLLFLSISCTTTHTHPILNSERIQQKFGSYGVHVLQLVPTQNSVRASSLYSVHNGQEITQTFAVTLFSEPINPALSQEDKLIRQEGKSIGSTFKEHGWIVNKQNIYIGTVDKMPSYVYALMHIEAQPIAVHIYKMRVKKGDLDLLYATIAEFHSPNYLQFDDVRRIYGNASEALQGEATLQQILLTIH